MRILRASVTTKYTFYSASTDSADIAPLILTNYKKGISSTERVLEVASSLTISGVNASFGEGFEILESRTIVPNFHELTIKAPEMARFARPGQFAVLMANADSERSPFTIIDWNAEEGWVKFILEEVGRSSAEIGALKKGDKLAVASGPLGTPINLDKFESGTSALLLGGCYGIGAIYPIARELKARGVKVTCAIDARAGCLFYIVPSRRLCAGGGCR